MPKRNEPKKNYMTADSVPLYLNVKDISDILNVSLTYAYNLLHAEDFPTIKLGKRKMVRKEKFFEWVDKHMEERDGDA